MSEKLSQFADSTRTFLLQNRYAVLSTISVSQAGFPFGSIVPYDITEDGDIIIYISLIAEHYKNLTADPRASLIATNYFAYNDPQAAARATALCHFLPINSTDKEVIQSRYLEKFPNSINHEIAHNFLFMRGIPEKIRWIGGFGDIGWVSKDKYKAATPDPLATSAFEIIEHMNDEHSDALKELLLDEKGAGVTNAQNIRMIEINSQSFTMSYSLKGQSDSCIINFCSPVISSELARQEFIRKLQEIRKKKPN